MKKALSLAIALFASAMAAKGATYNYEVVSGHSTNTWTQASTDTTNGYRWSDVNNWLDTSAIVENGKYAFFNRGEGSDVALNAVTRATGIIVAEDAGAVKIKANANSYFLGLRRNGDKYPNIINLSAHPIFVDAYVQFSYGQDAQTVGVMPGVVFNRPVTFESGVNQFNFYDGDTSKSEEMNTTLISNSMANVTRIYQLPNHKVVLDGANASLSCGTYNLRAPLVVNGGTLAFSSMVLQNNPTITLTDATVKTADLNNTFDATINVNGSLTLDTTGGDLVVGAMTYGADATSLTLTGGGSFAFKSGAAHLFDSVTITGEDAMTLKSWPLAEGKKMKLATGATIGTASTYTLKVSKSAKVVTAADFQEIPASGGVATITVLDDAEDSTLQVVTVTYPNYVTFTTTGIGDNDTFYMNTTTKWSNNAVAQSSYDYLVAPNAATYLRSSKPSSDVVKFNGKSLTLKGASSSKEALAMQKCTSAEFDKLVFLDYSGYRLGGNGSNSNGKTHTVKGNLVVASETVTFYSEASRIFSHESGSISGDGALKLAMAGTTDGIFQLYQDNSGFTGTIEVNGTGTTAKFDDADGVGGNPDVVQEKGLNIAYGTVEFTATEALIIDQPNRGLYTYVSGTISNAYDVTWMGPVGFSNDATLTKKGDGKLILAGRSTAAGTIAVSEGAVVAANPYAAGLITVTGTAMLPSLTLTAEEESAKKFAAKDWLFVPDGDANKTPVENLALMTARGWMVPKNYDLASRWATTLSQVTVEGGVMLKVSGRVRGFVIIIH